MPPLIPGFEMFGVWIPGLQERGRQVSTKVTKGQNSEGRRKDRGAYYLQKTLKGRKSP